MGSLAVLREVARVLCSAALALACFLPLTAPLAWGGARLAAASLSKWAWELATLAAWEYLVWYYSVQYRRVQGGVARGATLLSTKRTAAAWASVRQMQKCKFGQGACA